MGRGRAKAKQTKVARRLKYYSPDTDLTALERELKAADVAGGDGDQRSSLDDSDADEDYGPGEDDDDDDAWSAELR